jgi:hypothetical protein
MESSEAAGNSQPTERLSGVRLFLLASAVYLACMLPYFLAYAPFFTTSLIGPPSDNLQDFWNTWYSQKVWDAGGAGFFHTNLVRYPEGIALYYHTFAYSGLLMIFLVRKLFFLSTDVPALLALHNGALLASLYLSALGAFYLARRFTQNTVSALLAGFIFGFCPFHVSHMLTHMHVTTMEFIPFFVLCFLRAAETGGKRYLAGSIALYCLSALSSWYYLVYIGYFLVFYYVYQAVKKKKLLLPGPLRAILANLAGTALLLSPILVPMVAQGWRNPDVYASGSAGLAADALGYFVFDPYHLFTDIGKKVYAHFSEYEFEVRVYLGLVNAGLFAWAFWNRRRRQLPEMTFLLSGILVFMMFASGPYLQVYGHPLLVLPTMALEHLPFLSNMRTAARAAVFVFLLFGIGAGMGMDLLIQSCRERRRSPWVWLAPICIAVFLDFYPSVLPRTNIAEPRAYAILAADRDGDFGILDLPRGYVQGNAYMLFQTFHHRPIVAATLSRRIARTLMDNLETEDMAAQKRQLTAKKVKYIFIHGDLVAEHHPAERVNLADYGKTYPAVYVDDYCVVLRVY